MPLLTPEHTVAFDDTVPATVLAAFTNRTVSFDARQVPLVIVQHNAYVPGTRLLTLLFAVDTAPKLTVEGPDIIDQVPVPSTGLLAASSVLVTLHKAWSGPAFATVGFPYTNTSVESVLLQPKGEVAVMRYRSVRLLVVLFVSISVIVVTDPGTAFVEFPVMVPVTAEELHV